MKHFSILPLCLIVGIMLSACDKEHVKSYYVENQSAIDILVTFQIDAVSDSLLVEANHTELIYSDVYYFGSVGVDDDRYQDAVSDLAIQTDTSLTQLDESAWQYTEIDKYHAHYLMQID